jgi:hypothetical protein
MSVIVPSLAAVSVCDTTDQLHLRAVGSRSLSAYCHACSTMAVAVSHGESLHTGYNHAHFY